MPTDTTELERIVSKLQDLSDEVDQLRYSTINDIERDTSYIAQEIYDLAGELEDEIGKLDEEGEESND